jgi:hypothetical protein
LKKYLPGRFLDLPWCFRLFGGWRRRRWRVQAFVEDGIAFDFAQSAALSNPIHSEAAGTPPDAALVETAGDCYVRAAALERTGRQGQSAAATIALELASGVNLRVAL